MKIAVVDSGIKKWTSAIAVDSIVAPVITSAGSIAITPTTDVHITCTGGTSFVHIESVGAGAGIQFERPDASDAGSMITWKTAAVQKWKAGPLGDGTNNWIIYNTNAASNAIAISSATNVTTISSLVLGAALPVSSGGTGQISYTNGQLLIGNTTGNTLAKATLTGTTNQITVTNGAGTITISAPQDIGTSSSPTFNGLTLTTPLSVGNGGTGQSSYTNGQLLIGNTTGGTLTKATLTGTSNQITVTNGTGSITLATPQNIHTAATPQFAKIGVNAAAHATAKIYTTDSSSNTILVETTAATGQAGLQCALKNGVSAVRTFSFATRGDLDASGTFNIADETAGAIRMSVDQNGWVGFGGVGLSRLHAIEATATASERGIISEQFLNGTTGGTFIGRKARISGSSRIAITTGDILADFKAQGHDGTGFIDAGKIQVISTGTIGTNRMPSDMVFYTSTDVSTSVVTEAMRLTAAQKLALAGQVSKYNGITTAGGGVPAIYGQGRQTGRAAAFASVATYTVGAADASFLVWANVLVTTATTHSFTVTCAYTDEGNTARTLTLSFSLVAGGAMTTTIANAAGAVPYQGIPIAIRCKASTAITIATTGTFTTVLYNVEGFISQVS